MAVLQNVLGFLTVGFWWDVYSRLLLWKWQLSIKSTASLIPRYPSREGTQVPQPGHPSWLLFSTSLQSFHDGLQEMDRLPQWNRVKMSHLLNDRTPPSPRRHSPRSAQLALGHNPPLAHWWLPRQLDVGHVWECTRAVLYATGVVLREVVHMLGWRQGKWLRLDALHYSTWQHLLKKQKHLVTIQFTSSHIILMTWLIFPAFHFIQHSLHLSPT